MTVLDVAMRRATITWVLAAGAAVLALASVVGDLAKILGGLDGGGWIWRLSLNGERNIPARYSMLLLLCAAALLAFICFDTKRQRGRDVSKWAILALGFVYLALDEYFGFHEMLIDPVRAILGNRDLGIFYFAWVIPGAAAVLVVGLFFLGFLWRLPRWARVAFTLAAALYVGGALGVELFEGKYAELYGKRNLGFSAFVTVEECLEMAGVIVFINALLRYVVEHCRGDYRLFPKLSLDGFLGRSPR